MRTRFLRRSGALPRLVVLLASAGTTPARNAVVRTVLHPFAGSDGSQPGAGLVQDVGGNFYGTTSGGGADDLGTAFKLTPTGTLTTLSSFAGTDGNEPHAALVEGNDGDFYGVTHHGGLYGYNGSGGAGTVFRVESAGGFNVLHNFNGTDGIFPYHGLTKGGDGNLYGTTHHAAFGIDGRGDFTHVYDSEPGTGGRPSGLTLDAAGNLYGTAPGSDACADGNLFEPTVAPVPSSFFAGQVTQGNGVYFLNHDTVHPTGYDFGYYGYLEDRHYIYHFELGYEYVFDAADGQNGVSLYDFQSQDSFYTSPSYPCPYQDDFGLKSVVCHSGGPEFAGPGHNPVDNRYSYVFSTGQTINK